MLDPEIQQLIDRGIMEQNDDGTFRFTEEAEDWLQAKINEDPKLFAQWFPTRLN